MKNIKKIVVLFLLLFSVCVFAQEVKHNSLGTGNPIIPGYFADPTVKKWGDTYYLYATTDGNGFGLGPSQVWTSKDFVNWYMEPMDWPNTPIYWAPDVNRASDGKYYMYYSQPCELYGASSTSPRGPWTPLLPGTEAVVPNYFVPNVITLDGQTFQDDDGKMYMFWGTWGIYPNSGCGVGLLNADMKSFAKTDMIPNTIAKDFFEAPFMFKRKGIYYLMYSAEHCEDDSYKVHYVMSKAGPMGPFTYGENSPILVTNEDGTVHGPGHNSVLQEGDDFFIVYHRHNNPHSGGGFHRQIAADRLEFDAAGNIKKVVPTHKGVGALAKKSVSAKNLALGKKTSASSVYSQAFKAEYAADDNNGTLWKAADNMREAWWQVDIGELTSVRSVLTQFEYATWYYQYLIEYSTDGKQWNVFADRSKNTQWGSPMKDYGDVKARYLRITIKNSQVAGLNKAIWNVKVFAEAGIGRNEGKLSLPQKAVERQETRGLLVDLDADRYELRASDTSVSNQGVLGGEFVVKKGAYQVDLVQGKKAFIFDGQTYWQSRMHLPPTLSGNSSFTISAWVNNPSIAKEEPLIQWSTGGRDLMHASLGFGADKSLGGVVHGGWANIPFKNPPSPDQWHHIVLVFDGTEERLYIDGILENEGNRMLFLEQAGSISIGTDRRLQHYFSGALASLKMYDRALTNEDIRSLQRAEKKSPYFVSFEAKDLSIGPVKQWKNKGYGISGISFEDGQAEVVTRDNRMGVRLKEGKKQLLNFFRQSLDSMATFSLLFVYADRSGKVQSDSNLSALIKKGNQTYRYKAGKLEKALPVEKEMDLLLPSGEFYLHACYLLDEAWEENRLERLTSALLNTKMTDTIHPVYHVKPKWVTKDLAFMQADTLLSDQGFHFSFKRIGAAGASSPWQSATDYLAQDLSPDEQAAFRFYVRDRFGNVFGSEEVSLARAPRNLFSDFKKHVDYATHFSSQQDWDGVEGITADSVHLGSQDGFLRLASAKSAWDGSEKKGPFLYKEVVGNFLMQLRVSDLSGLEQKKPLGANEVGLMVRRAKHEEREELLQNGVMLGWGIGNMVTDLQDGRRQQHNNTGFDFYSYLQIQREGTFIFVRGSKDGKKWVEFPGSPYFKPEWEGETLQVGPYQASYGDKKGYGVFAEIRLYQYP
ncbi:family 43 glycosylhydrolase [Olivibacter sp. XZL3]|uniref:family 43 glycosylhydrolase n=1 Tax=Olivibacter sp. XZL3 TaxID=1735116 RepID=UPI0010659E71|nr:family 43 glycosylhydrolase [Olivibacter sp. XZL3]